MEFVNGTRAIDSLTVRQCRGKLQCNVVISIGVPLHWLPVCEIKFPE